MRKLPLAIAALLLAGAAYEVTSGQASDSDLRRVECNRMTVFAPKGGSSADDLCRGYGGVAQTGASPSEEGLVILVRNQPMGGFSGQSALR